MVHTCNPRSPEVEAERSQTQGYPLLHTELEASLGYMRLYLKKGNENQHVSQQQCA